MIENGYSYGNLPAILDEIIIKQDLKNRKVILFGISFFSKVLKRLLKDKDINVYAIIDNNIEKSEDYYDGLKVYTPEKLLKNFDDNVAVFIASVHHQEMIQQLQSMEYELNKHIFFVLDYIKIEQELKESIYSKYRVLTIEEIQKEELNILKYIKEICENYNLKYFLCGGTLLGAIRHHGFIPWDDDIDISMPYPDYIKFLQIVLKENKYSVLYGKECDNFQWGYSKICHKKILGQQICFPIPPKRGLFVDIFPIYSIPDDEKLSFEILSENRKITPILRDIETWLFDKNNLISQKNKLITMWDSIGYYKTKKVLRTSVGASGYFNEEVVSYKAYESNIMIEFCGMLFPVPVGYDEILENLYGDYMVLPPEEKRVSHHYDIYYYI